MMDSFMNWRMFADEDNLAGFDRRHNKFLDIYVLNPRTHIKNGKALFTDYEINVKTNHPEFALKESKVRRRYSEFVWLKDKLGINDVMMVTAPSLPGKRYFGRFKDPFLRKRLLGLQHFMNKVVEINAFLSEPALHFFLQSETPVQEMDYYLYHSGHLSNIRDRIIAMQKLSEKRELRRQMRLEKKLERDARMRRYSSLDNILSTASSPLLNDDMMASTSSGGRGWSRYYGLGYHAFTHHSDEDMTDNVGDARFRSQSSSTARVLPGGQLCLALDDDIEVFEKPNSLQQSRRCRSNSWHGRPSDIVDLLLGEYEVIRNDSDEVLQLTNEIETIASSSRTYSINNTTMDSRSFDDGIEVDISKCLDEYNIVTLPGHVETRPKKRDESLFQAREFSLYSNGLFIHSDEEEFSD